MTGHRDQYSAPKVTREMHSTTSKSSPVRSLDRELERNEGQRESGKEIGKRDKSKDWQSQRANGRGTRER